MTDKNRFLLILKYQDIAKKCEDCKKAGVEIEHFEYLSEVVRRIAGIKEYANCEVVGIYKQISKMVIDKNCLVQEWE